MIQDKNNNIIRRKKIKLSVKKKVFVTLQRVKYKRRCKYMKGYNFLFFMRMEETARKGSMEEWFGKYDDDDGALKFRVRKARKKMDISPSFQLSRLSAGTNRKIAVRNNWFNAFYFPPRACSSHGENQLEILSYSKNIFLHSSLDYFSTLVVKCSIWIKNTNELFIYGPWIRFK